MTNAPRLEFHVWCRIVVLRKRGWTIQPRGRKHYVKEPYKRPRIVTTERLNAIYRAYMARQYRVGATD